MAGLDALRADGNRIATRYWLSDGRKLDVREVARTNVVESLILLGIGTEPTRVVSADNGVYFALCARRARCPYPGRSAVSRTALLPRRLALALAARVFAETLATLVVVALPTAQPMFFIVERGELNDPRRLFETLAADGVIGRGSRLRPLIDGLTRARLFVPDTLVTVSDRRDALVVHRL